jgi:Na+/H+ antiporter NhaD/arsenite permease-like protein
MDFGVSDKNMIRALKNFVKGNVVFVIALAAAVISSFFGGAAFEDYIGFIDFKTISCLFCIMTVIEACRNIKLFRITAAFLLKKFSTARKMVFALVFITFVFSMFIANDMALLTFLPFAYMVLGHTKNVRLIAFTIIMQNIAANLGGLLTPFGNPQNLYLFSFYHIPSGEFLGVMLPPFLLSLVLITACCFCVKNIPLNYSITDYGKISKKRSALYIAMFLFTALTVFRFIPYTVCLAVIVILLFIFDRKAFKTVDYPLLFTFVFFFIFTGNIARIDAISGFLNGLIMKSPFFTALLSCQLISNVPTAVLFSKFVPAEFYKHLLWAVNVGGMGTLIASLASLISYRSFVKQYPEKGLMYLGGYSLVNFSFVGLYVIMYLLIF